MERRKRLKKITAAISCLCLCALVGAGAWRNGLLGNAPTEAGGAAVVPGGATVPVEDSAGAEQVERPQPARIEGSENSASESPAGDPAAPPASGGEPVISVDAAPLAPAAVDLTQQALYEAVGGFLPDEGPEGFAFGGAVFSEYGYSVFWSKGMDELNWRIRDFREEDARRLTRVEDIKNYDLSLYPIPRAESVPEELRQMVDNPIFHAEELTQAAVDARAYRVSDAGDSDGYRMHFSVLYGDKMVTVTSKGVSPEWMFRQLSGLYKSVHVAEF